MLWYAHEKSPVKEPRDTRKRPANRLIPQASFLAPPPASYAWFVAGVSLFSFTYYFILSIVRFRLDFFVECARDAGAKQSIRYLKVCGNRYP